MNDLFLRIRKPWSVAHLLPSFPFFLGLLFVLAFFLLPQTFAAVPAYRASGTFTAGTGTITPTYPASMAANDVCLLAVESENQAISLTTANGFAQIPTWSPQFAGTAATNPASRLALFWKRTVGGDTAPLVADSGNHTTGRIHCFSGVITSGDPWDTGAGGNDGAANDTSGAIPGATTASHETLVVLITSTSFNGTSTAQCSAWTNATLTSLTERTDNTNTAGLGGGHCMATGVLATAGIYATTTVTLANTSFKGAISLALKPVPVTTLGAGVGPANSTIAPGAAATMTDAFTLQTNTGTDVVTSVVVGLAAGTSGGLSLVEITNDAGTIVYGSVANPASDTPSITLSTNTLTVTTTQTQYKIRVTPKSHANMPAPPGSAYAVTAKINSGTSTNAQAGSDAAGTTITIDNLSPAGATAASGTAGNLQVTLNWTTSASADFSRSVMLRWASGTAGTEVPAEGIDYVNGNTIGTATVVCVRTADGPVTAVSGVDGAGAGGCSASALAGGTYTYKVFQKDSNGNYDVGVGVAVGVVVTVAPPPGDFNAFETATAAGAVTGRIYTKLAGVNFSLDVVAILATAQHATFTDTVQVDLVTGSAGGLNCPGAPAVIAGTSQNVNLTGGRGTTGNFNVASAAPNVRVRMRYPAVSPTVTSCSTDNFSIRPTAFTVTSTDATQTGTSGTPAIKTGANFNLAAASGVIGYTGTPLIDNTKVVGTPTAGSIGGSFAAAPAGTGTAAGNTFFYNEVGNFGLNANAVYDSGFTSVDQPGDCTADFSNALAGGKYGCYFGSVAIPQATGASGFGRFIPDNFAVSYNSPQVGTTCGAGPFSFSYVGQPFTYVTTPVMTVTARNGTSNGLANATTVNYAGAYMKFSNTAGASLNQAPYATQGDRYSRFDALGGGTTPALDTSQLPATTADPAIGAFTAGVGTLTFAAGGGFVFTRPTTAPNAPSAPFSADIALALNIIDGDGVAYVGNPAAFGAATSGNGMAFSADKFFRFGRLRLMNAYGSELLDIRVPLRAEYYNGGGWSLNADDNCTAIPTSAFFTSGGLSPVIQSTSPLTLSGGLGTLVFNKTGTAGSFNLAANLNAAGADTSCNPAHGGTAANLPWLQGFWAPAASCGGTAAWAHDPNARIKLGTPKAPYIYLRERY